MAPEVELREINMENFRECIRLSVGDEQRNFVASNTYSLAEAKADGVSVPLAVYSGDVLVGFTMYCFDDKSKIGYIDRLMIDKKYQRQGYGRAAMVEVINRLRNTPGCDRLRISYCPGNAIAEALYNSLGFRPTGEIDGGEIVAVYDLS